MIAYADFFTGIAGCVIAAELVGFTPVSFCEIEEFPRRLLKHYWPEVPILHDIRTVTADDVRAIGRIDPAHFSPPCQSLSIAGKQEATEDLRYLWPDTARVISLLRPTWLCIENVDNAVNLVLDDWITDLDRLGYETAAIVLPAAGVGAPHIRNRVFLVAHAKRDESERGGGFGELGGAPATDEGEAWERERLRDTVGHSRTAMANPNGRGQQERLQCDGLKERRLTAPCRDNADRRDAALANTPSARSGTGRPTRRGSLWDGARREESERRRGANGGIAFMENSTGEGRGPARCREDEFADSAGAFSRFAGSDTRGDATNGTTDPKPCMGGDVDEFSRRLDGYTLRGLTWNGWPAGMGHPQYDDEPPRTGGNPKQRRARIKAIGNAVPPMQIYPIFKAIADEIRSCQP